MRMCSVAKMTCLMKQFFSYLGASLAAIAALASCNKEIEAPVEDLKGGVPFEICASADDTKTAINEAFKTTWIVDGTADQINVYHKEASALKYTCDNAFTAQTVDGKFSGTLTSALMAEKEYQWLAKYPYDKDLTTPTEKYSYIGSRSDQTQSQTGLNSTAHLSGYYMPLVGKGASVGTATPTIAMKHASSVIEINVTNNTTEALDVTSIVFTAPESIIGQFVIDYTGETTTYTEKTYASAVATLSVTDGTIAAGKSGKFYIAIKPFSATSEQKLSLSVNGYSKEIPHSSDVTFTAGKIKKINFKYDYVAPSPQPYVLWHESISDGDYIIVGVNDADYSALNTTISSDRAGLTSVSIVNNTITTNDATIIWHIEKAGDYYTIYNAAENKYLASTGAKNKAQLLVNGTDDKSLWTITGPEKDNTFSIVNKKNTANGVNANLRRNGNNGFATYALETGSAPVLYKLDARELESIAITTPATKTTFNTGDTFSSDGLVVTATFSDASSSVIVPVVETPDMSSVGTKTVNVSYTFKEVTKSTSYDIVVEARPAFAVTLADDSTILTETEAGSGVELPSRTTNIEGYTFVGWSETECDAKTTTSPTIIPTGTYYPTENVTLYPIYKQTVSSTGWELVTDLSKVTEGVYALVTSTYNNSKEYKAFNGSISSSGHGSTTTSGFEFTNGFAASAPEGTCELTLTISGSGFTMYKEGNGYLYAKAKTSGNLAWHSSETSYWSYKSSNWTYASNSAYLRSYSNSSFRTYGSNNGQALWMAKKTTKDVDYYISTPVAE